MGVLIMDKPETDKELPVKKCITVEAENLDPWAAVALFKFAQNVCKRHGLAELVEVGCSITVTFAGQEDVSTEAALKMLENWQGAKITETEAA